MELSDDSSEIKYFRVRADIDLDAVRQNILSVKEQLAPDTKVCAVIKADGYGHGAVQIAEFTDDLTDFIAVATIDEAMDLRHHNISKPILILGYCHPQNALKAAENDIRFTVFDPCDARILSETVAGKGLTLKIHIKIDTGMSRIGFQPEDSIGNTVNKISRLPGLEVEGVFTHFYSSDGEDSRAFETQLEMFNRSCELIEQAGTEIRIRHCANSAAAVRYRSADMDMVRLGIVMYGLYPSEFVHDIKLFPAMSVKSHVVMVKDIPAGRSIGYGATFTAKKDMRIATIPVGYADGYFRRLSNKGFVLIGGKRAPITGRVCMDQFMVDVSDIADVKAGDEVVLLGRSGNEEITAEELSELAGSFNYELVCDVSKRVPRVYYSEGRVLCAKDYFDS